MIRWRVGTKLVINQKTYMRMEARLNWGGRMGLNIYAFSAALIFLSSGVVAQAILTEYVDLQSPFVAQQQTALDQLERQYAGRLEVQVKHFPITNIFPNSFKAAEASECARDQGKFNEYKRVLLANQNSLGIPSLKAHAAAINGIDTLKFNECLDSSRKAQKVNSDFAEASEKGVLGVPAFEINGRIIQGTKSFNELEAIVEGVIATPSTSPKPSQVPQPSAQAQPITVACMPNSQGTEQCVSASQISVSGEYFVSGPARSPEAVARVVFYSDLQSHFAQAVDSVLNKKLKSEYGSRIELEFRHYPLEELYAFAREVAEASECARSQGKFEEFKQKVFESTGQRQNQALLEKHAQEIGLNSATFETCISSGGAKQTVDNNIMQAKADNVEGVPTVFVGENRITGAYGYDAFQDAVEGVLNGRPVPSKNFMPLNLEPKKVPAPDNPKKRHTGMDSQLADYLDYLGESSQPLDIKITLGQNGLDKTVQSIEQEGGSVRSIDQNQDIHATLPANKVDSISIIDGLYLSLDGNYQIPPSNQQGKVENQNSKAPTPTIASETEAKTLSSRSVELRFSGEKQGRLKISRDSNGIAIESGGVTATAPADSRLGFSEQGLTIEETELKALPDGVLATATEELGAMADRQIKLKKTDSGIAYQIDGTKKAKILWLIPVEYPVGATIDATNGKLISASRPWWKFLVGG